MIENRVCGACGAAVRQGALFCYNCGADISKNVAVKEEKIAAAEIAPPINLIPNIENVAGNLKGNPEPVDVAGILGAEIPVQKIADAKLSEPAPLKPAAAMRKKPKLIRPKKIEVIWEEHEDAPNVWFISVAVFLTILAVVILFLAVRMK